MKCIKCGKGNDIVCLSSINQIYECEFCNLKFRVIEL
jgi:hypothetical protein